MSFAREAWPFVAPLAIVTVLLLMTDWRRAGVICLIATVGILLFFRIPRRPIGGEDNLLLAPASGRITAIEPASDDAVGSGDFTRIVTFLSVFDVHVQRAPAAGKVVATEFRRGRKVAAFRPDAGEVNESRLTVFELSTGERVGVRQIAGLVARRVVGYLHEGDSVRRGELIGVIKFGSRVDLLVPAQFAILVSEGQKVSEGLTPIASKAEAN